MELKPKGVLMSIKPKYTKKIYLGEKTVELRRQAPTLIGPGDMVVIYESSPVQAITGMFECGLIDTKENPMMLWPEVHNKCCLSFEEFLSYFDGAQKGSMIEIKDYFKFGGGVTLETLRYEINNFRPPQSFTYIAEERDSVLYDLIKILYKKYKEGASH